MSAPSTILASSPSFCRKLSKLVEIWQSSGKNNFAQFFRHGVHVLTLIYAITVLPTYRQQLNITSQSCRLLLKALLAEHLTWLVDRVFVFTCVLYCIVHLTSLIVCVPVLCFIFVLCCTCIVHCEPKTSPFFFFQIIVSVVTPDIFRLIFLFYLLFQ